MVDTAVLGYGVKVDDVSAHFTDSQDKDSTFRNVSSVWTKQCISFDDGRNLLAKQQSHIVDLKEPLSAFAPVVTNKGQFAIRYLKNGCDYVPTPHALKQIAVVGETSAFMLEDLTNDKVSNKKHEDIKYSRDDTDASLLVSIVKHTLFNPVRMDQNKVRLVRTWNDGTLRALLSSQYAIVNNDWYLSVLEEFIPGGLLSHWRGDADTIFGNVLIPDTIRQESDSAYGGMLSVGNSEIGIRRIFSMPSVFRAICMNGCIWGQQKGKSCGKVHRGAINMDEIKSEIKSNLEAQIPLLGDGIRQMLGTRGRCFGNVSVTQMLCATAILFKISRKNMVGIRGAFDTEVGILGNSANSAFGIINSLTRYGQTCDTPDEWNHFDRLGGNLTMQSDDDWNRLRALGATITDNDVVKLIGA